MQSMSILCSLVERLRGSSIVRSSIACVAAVMQALRSVSAVLVLAMLLGAGQAVAAETVNINQAGAAELAQQLSGVGAVKAQAIVDYRDTHGPFVSVEQLTEVKGIGERLMENNRERIQLGSEQAMSETATQNAERAR